MVYENFVFTYSERPGIAKLCHDPSDTLCIWRLNHKTWRGHCTNLFILKKEILNVGLKVITSQAMDVENQEKSEKWLNIYILNRLFLVTYW